MGEMKKSKLIKGVDKQSFRCYKIHYAEITGGTGMNQRLVDR